MIRILLGAFLVLAVLFVAGVFDKDESSTASVPPVILDGGRAGTDPPITNSTNNDPPPGDNTGSTTVTYTVAHGDIREDGDCHLRVFGPGEAITITSRGTWKTQPITVSSEAELRQEVEDLRDTVSRWSRTGTCPNG